MSNILEQIVRDKRIEVEKQKSQTPLRELAWITSKIARPRMFKTAVTTPGEAGINLIAEIKHKSPSAGVIREPFNPRDIAGVYQNSGAAAISVLTDEKYFGGRLELIKQVRDAVRLPVLRKDFIVDSYQITQSRAFHADAILLITEVLSPGVIRDYAGMAADLGMSALIEAHDEAHLQGVLDALGSPLPENVLIGINNRDLSIQQTDVATTARLAKLLPPDTAFVSESGIHSHDDVRAVQQAGAKAILVGESILKAQDMSARICELLGTG